jgi:hypothetical protein
MPPTDDHEQAELLRLLVDAVARNGELLASIDQRLQRAEHATARALPILAGWVKRLSSHPKLAKMLRQIGE